MIGMKRREGVESTETNERLSNDDGGRGGRSDGCGGCFSSRL